MTSSCFSWVEPYSAIAHAIYKLKDDRQRLFEIFESIFKSNDGLPFPFSAGGEELSTVDPFTFFSSFNRGLTFDKRQRIIELAAEKLGLSMTIPKLSYEGIPTVPLRKTWFIAAENDRGPHDVDNLWDLFCAALEYADDSSSELLRQKFVVKYDVVIGQKHIKWNITMGLFWIAPTVFMPLDRNSERI